MNQDGSVGGIGVLAVDDTFASDKKAAVGAINGATLLSIVVPCFNEESAIALTHAAICEALSEIDIELELLFVDDGSSDSTMGVLREISTQDMRVKVLSLSRNFGHQIAVSAGLDHVSGDVIVVIDGDLQDPPSVIVDMLVLWREGYDVVYGKREARDGETRFKLVSAKYFYQLLNSLSDVSIPRDTGDFRLMDRRVVEALKCMPERDRFLRGMVAWAGFNQIGIAYERQPRVAGTTKYPLSKMVSFAATGILSFSSKPLRVATWFGLSISLLAAMGVFYAVFMRIFTSTWVSGWTFLVVAVLLIGGIQLVFLGIIGEYIARIYEENKRRPLYFVKEKHGEFLRRCDSCEE